MTAVTLLKTVAFPLFSRLLTEVDATLIKFKPGASSGHSFYEAVKSKTEHILTSPPKQNESLFIS